MKPKAHRQFACLTITAIGISLIPVELFARGRSRSRSVHRSSSHHTSSVHRSTSTNRNVKRSTNVNRNVNVNRHIDVDVHNRYYGRGGAAAIGAAAGLVTGFAIGAAVASPPRGYTTVYYGSNPYAYYGGVYYQPADNGYVVAQPPIGVIVPSLPPGATVQLINGVSYFVFNGLYYQPVIVNGTTAYKTVAL